MDLVSSLRFIFLIFDNRLIHIRQNAVIGDPRILPKGTYKTIGKASEKRKRGIILKTILKTDSIVRSSTMNDILYNCIIEILPLSVTTHSGALCLLCCYYSRNISKTEK